VLEKPEVFFDRDYEWGDLASFVQDHTPGLRIGVVRGRQRHGKSFLLEHLCRAVAGVYTLALRQSRTMALDRFADRPCTTDADSGKTRTYAEHGDRVARLVGALADLGVGRGDRFGVMATNSPEYVELYHAAFLGAGVINPLNLRFAPRELAHALRDSGTKVCFVDFLFADLVDQIKDEVGLEHVVLIGELDGPHTARYDDLLADAKPRVPDEGEETDPVVLMYTGGTTGMPKGVLWRQADVFNAALGGPDRLARQPTGQRRIDARLPPIFERQREASP
jgi:acyl-CoA synthetase (AMP-forming)/AMP-acid ligase II